MQAILVFLLVLGSLPGLAQNVSLRWGSYYGAQVSSMKHVSDAEGNLIVAGSTNSSQLATTPGALQPSLKGFRNLFVAKYSGSGSLLWATYYGGSRFDQFRDLTSDAAGNLYIIGTTDSEDFPTTGLRGTGGFVLSLTGNGQRRWAVAGNGMKEVSSVAVDRSDNVAVCGSSGGGLSFAEASFGMQPTYGGNDDGFVVIFGANGVARAATYWGGSSYDIIQACSYDARGVLHAWIYSSPLAGSKLSRMVGFRSQLQGQMYDTRVAVSNSTCVGGIGNMAAVGETLWITGWACAGMETTADAQVATMQPKSTITSSPFLLRMTSSGEIRYLSYLNRGSAGGGSAGGAGHALVALRSGTIAVCGTTSATDFPVTANAMEKLTVSAVDSSGFVTLHSPDGKVIYGSYLNGSGSAQCLGASESNGNLVLSGLATVMPNLLRGVQPLTIPMRQLSVWIAGLQVSAGGVPVLTTEGVTNAASFAAGAVAPGEIVTLFVSGAGPSALAGLQLSADRRVTTVAGGTRVLFDGTPAPMVYAVAGQISAIVPYNVAGKSTVGVSVEYEGVSSGVVQVPVAAAAPGLFTLAGGVGQVVAVLESGCCNGPNAAARRGEVIVLYATGEGQTAPMGRDGSLAEYATLAEYPKPLLPVEVSVGGKVGSVLYAGAAPGFVAGLMQINLRLAADTPVGDQVPVVLKVGTFSSRAGVTMVVR